MLHKIVFCAVMAAMPAMLTAKECMIAGQVGTDWSKPSHKPFYSVQVLQQSLNRFGGANITVDGDLGPQTTRALKSFQSSQGLPVTGQPDPATLGALEQQWLSVGEISPITSQLWQNYPDLDIQVETAVVAGNCHVTLTSESRDISKTHVLDFDTWLTGCQVFSFTDADTGQSTPTYVRNMDAVGVMIAVKGPFLGRLSYGFNTPVIGVWPDGTTKLADIERYEEAARKSTTDKGQYPKWDGPVETKEFGFYGLHHLDYIKLHNNYWSWCSWE